VSHGFVPVACFDSELTSESMNPFEHDGRTPLVWGQPIQRLLPTQDSKTQKKKKKRGHTFMPRAGFEPTIPVF